MIFMTLVFTVGFSRIEGEGHSICHMKILKEVSPLFSLVQLSSSSIPVSQDSDISL